MLAGASETSHYTPHVMIVRNSIARGRGDCLLGPSSATNVTSQSVVVAEHPHSSQLKSLIILRAGSQATH